MQVVFRRKESEKPSGFRLPCGNCIGCRLDRSREWALRCVHEASLYEKNCFITLTYDAEHLPANGSVDVREFQLFMKRLRKKFGKEIRFFHCGEYGSKLERPHYHACLFNFDFDDKRLWSVRNDVKLYRSAELEALWGKGFATVGDVTPESAAYVARYVMKKVVGEKAGDHYGGKAPEYITMSRRPGIGAGWYEKFKGDVFPSDFVVSDGMKMKVPKFYMNRLDKENNLMYRELKKKRVERGWRVAKDNDLFRLKDKQTVKESRISSLHRTLEEM